MHLSQNTHSVSEPSEKALVNQWFALKPGDCLYDVDGNQVIIIDLGHQNHYDGPDILQTQMYMQEKIVSCDIECHLIPATWYSHGHHTDSRYNNVKIHLVQQYERHKKHPDICHIKLNPQQRPAPVDEPFIQTLSSHFLDTVRSLADQRWQKHVSLYQENDSPDNVILTSCKIFGTKGNHAGFTWLMEELFTNSNALQSVDEKVVFAVQRTTDCPFPWNKSGIRPAARYKQRLPMFVKFIEYILHNEFSSIDPKRVMKDLHSFLPAGLAVELLGNCIFPFLGWQALKRKNIDLYSHVKSAWDRLNLPYMYNDHLRRFGALLDRRQLRRFWINQGLLEYKIRFIQ